MKGLKNEEKKNKYMLTLVMQNVHTNDYNEQQKNKTYKTFS